MAQQSAFASNVTKNVYGAGITITTDKDEYEIGDSVDLSYVLKNNSSNDVQIVEVQSEASYPNVNLEAPSLPKNLSAGEGADASVEANVTAGFEQWKVVEIGGQSIRVGIRALTGIVEEGSEFIVGPVAHGSEEFQYYWDQLDNNNQVERVNFFNLGIKKPNGTLYSTMDNGPVTIYIQIPENWDEADLQAVYVSAEVDEQFQENFVTIDGIKYLSFNTNHFSPYAVIDLLPEGQEVKKTTDYNQKLAKLVNEEQKNEPVNEQINDTNQKELSLSNEMAKDLKPGIHDRCDISTVGAVLLFALVICFISGRKIENKTLVLLLSLVTLNFCDVSINSKVFADNDFLTVTDSIINIIYVGGNEVKITTKVTLKVVKPTISIEDDLFMIDEDVGLLFKDVPPGWTGRCEIIRTDDGRSIKSFSLNSSNIIDNTYWLSGLKLDEGDYTVKIYDYYGHILATLNFILGSY